MTTDEVLTETDTTQGTGSGITCDVVEKSGAECEDLARFWLEIIPTGNLVAVCAFHAEYWKRYATEHGIDPAKWTIYPMR